MIVGYESDSSAEMSRVFPETPLLLRLEDGQTGSAHYWWAVYRGAEKPCLQLMLLCEGEGPDNAKLRSFSRYNRRFRLDLKQVGTVLVAKPRNSVRGSVNGWTRWLAALVLAWTTEQLPEIKTLRLHGLDRGERTRLFPPDGRLSRIQQLAWVVRGDQKG
jgi:hypothetical protein